MSFPLPDRPLSAGHALFLALYADPPSRQDAAQAETGTVSSPQTVERPTGLHDVARCAPGALLARIVRHLAPLCHDVDAAHLRVLLAEHPLLHK